MSRGKLFFLAVILLIVVGGGFALRLLRSSNKPIISTEDQIAEVTRQIESGRISAEEGSKRLCSITARREEERQVAVDSIIDFSEDPQLLLEYQCNNYSPSRPADKPTREIYIGNGIIYTVSIASGTVLEVDTRGLKWILEPDGNRNLTPQDKLPTYSQTEMEVMVRNFIVKHLPGVDLDSFEATQGKKDSNYFFRWENTTRDTEGKEKAHIQVGLTSNGQLLNYYNSISQSN